MSRSCFLPFALLGVALTVGPRSGGPQTAVADTPSPFAAFVDDYFDAYFARKPSEGTAAGLHQYDDKLEDVSAGATNRRIETVKALQTLLGKLRAGAMTDEESIDAEVLAGLMRNEV